MVYVTQHNFLWSCLNVASAIANRTIRTAIN